MTRSNHPINQTQTTAHDGNHWAWLQSRLERTATQEASQELNEWLGQQLDDLEQAYSNMVTVSSRNFAAGLLVKSSRR